MNWDEIKKFVGRRVFVTDVGGRSFICVFKRRYDFRAEGRHESYIGEGDFAPWFTEDEWSTEGVLYPKGYVRCEDIVRIEALPRGCEREGRLKLLVSV